MEHQGFKKVLKHKFIYNAASQFNLSKEEGKKWVKLFNQSAAIGFLPPLRDAQEILTLLNKNYGYRFVVCTSLSNDKAAQELRTRNLRSTLAIYSKNSSILTQEPTKMRHFTS